MLDFKRRMPRFELIPQIRYTNVIIDNLKKLNYEHEKITVIRLRHAKLQFENYEQIAIDAMKQQSLNDDRMKEIFDNIREISVENSLNTDILPSFNLLLITQKAKALMEAAQAGGDELDYNNL